MTEQVEETRPYEQSDAEDLPIPDPEPVVSPNELEDPVEQVEATHPIFEGQEPFTNETVYGDPEDEDEAEAEDEGEDDEESDDE